MANDEITMANLKDSPLLALPAEVRLMIYGHVFDGCVAYHLSKRTLDQHVTPVRSAVSSRDLPRIMRPLLTCRQIAAEAMKSFFNAVFMAFRANWYDMPHFPNHNTIFRGSARYCHFIPPEYTRLITTIEMSKTHMEQLPDIDYDWQFTLPHLKTIIICQTTSEENFVIRADENNGKDPFARVVEVMQMYKDIDFVYRGDERKSSNNMVDAATQT